MIIRQAQSSDLEAIFMLGYDAWGEGDSKAAYLQGCQASPKYLQGQWYVLESVDSQIVSALILYDFEANCHGVGSIATAPDFRGQGHATSLLTAVLQQIEKAQNSVVYLYSDIAPQWYVSMGFEALPPEHQKYKTTLCMARGQSLIEEMQKNGYQAPEYF